MGRDPNELLGKISVIPPLPAIAARILELADNDHTSALELAHVVSADQGLTAQLIRASNSAFYGYERRVTTVRESIVLLGFKQVRQMCVSACIINNFRNQPQPTDGFNLDLYWGHSVVVAIVAEGVARGTRAAKPEDAFTAGILHDIGRLALRQAMPREFKKSLELVAKKHVSLGEAELQVTGFAHDELGHALAEQWHFPAPLVDALSRHHDETLTVKHDGLAGIISTANRLAWHYGLLCGYEGATVLYPDELPPDLREVERLCGGMHTVMDRAFGFIEAASGTPGRWFAEAG